MNRYRQQDNLLGQSNSFLEVLEQISQIAPLNKPVLIIGERGTGKEGVAARLHFLSKRWDQTYSKLNCAALSESLLESELFGYEAGAFTGAAKRREGRFEAADNGTLFLDELANTSGLIQEKLLRVIEYGEFERVGGSKSVKVDIRLIAATNEDLPGLAQSGEFRADLLDRLAFDVITLPPLRERKDDIMMLAEHFAINMARELEMEVFSGFTEKAKRTLLEYEWPGNIRELKNVVERAVYRANNPDIPVHNIVLDPFESIYRPATRMRTSDRIKNQDTAIPSTLPTAPESPTPVIEPNVQGPTSTQSVQFPVDLKELSQNFEIDLIKQALADSQYNQKKTAERLSLTYHQLRGYLKKYNLLDTPPEDRE
ncbi:MAG: phage shock protein operon transcriptional activator [Alteromonadaceae bacterium]|uniref:Sigma-54-dependent Fis family transcriptional regulator n=1 Tax=Paraglaciecola chathamensis TaxID=368405 RepID=A0A8H9M2X4_9ALTE|nr:MULTISPECIES: phage shock protein operon transcriptional activator [Paraglaciecola]AEE22284.1 sigma54 specific transcriptional activator, PspF, Fis family [Glaciecola sp. 4H-3-7+YE-5]MBN27940.1 phage shock protein operon transcriptional activator [Alteromonadaceae bacterium]GGZ56025.1 sigma-54-dependent Fis family transcriptional regulator [Paraglaciecola oceanifecundans]|tara:strand:- start:61539 stop:62648 length:1110 start_codon:yes stop_codon:yes gene_type:complete